MLENANHFLMNLAENTHIFKKNMWNFEETLRISRKKFYKMRDKTLGFL